MRVAIVHDWLHSKVGGAESVLFELVKHFPQADVYALTYNEKLFRPYMGMRHVRTSFLNKFPQFMKDRPQFFLPFIKPAVESFDLSDYDLIVSSSTAWSKNVKVAEGVRHISYCNSPARMLWDSWPGYMFTKARHVGPVRKFFITKLASKLRLWDFYATENVTKLIGNSNYIARRIKKFYGKDALVLYPPIDVELHDHNSSQEPYWLVLSTLSRYKNIELAITAFAASGKKLIIAGEGPDRTRLERLAKGSSNIVFKGRVSSEEKFELFSGAEAFIFPSIEDFGITPIEALSCGTPVVALRGGGLAETVTNNKTGVFFSTADADALNAAVEKSSKISWDRPAMQQSALAFSKEVFHEKLDKIVAGVMA